MFKRLLFVGVLAVVTTAAMAQSWEMVKKSDEYLYGEGRGATIGEADKQALESLISKIKVSVTSQTSNTDRSVTSNGVLSEQSQFEKSVNTYSAATLTNTEMVIITNEPNAHVGRWIRKSEVRKLFELRITKLKDMVSMAQKAEVKGKVDDALRNYYWAFTLLKSVQNPNEVMYDTESGEQVLLVTWIPQRMNEIFSQIDAKVTKREGNEVELRFLYKDKPVNSLDYTYFDGRAWSNIYSAKDGVGVLELVSGNTSSEYQLKYEFEYSTQTLIDPELKSVMDVVKSTPMPSAYVNVRAKASAQQYKPYAADVQGQVQGQKVAASETFTSTNAAILRAPKAVDDASYYQTCLAKVIRAIASKNSSDIRHYFTNEGWDIYTRLIGYGSARVVGEPNLKFMQQGNYVVGRGVQMAFSFATGSRKSFVEDVTFTFDADRRICSLAFGLGNTAVDDILNKGVWSEEARLGIMAFLENYKTAYSLKRLDYITSIFDDDAVIIVGNVVKRPSAYAHPDLSPMAINSPIIKHNRYTKNQYLSNLARCFASNEFINIRFANNDVYKYAKGGELYAIQIAQDYYSSNYGDKGYLFLVVDINDPQHPIIKVRTWQPEKDPNFGLYGPGDF